MVRSFFHEKFKKAFIKLKDRELKQKIIKQISKIKEIPEIGKPMRHSRKGTRELYIKPFRLSYSYIEKEDKVVILDIYHKDQQ